MKGDGRKRARLVALGYMQVEGVDYHHLHAPIVSEQSIRILLDLKLKFRRDMMVIDIKSAFLESTLREELYVRLPKNVSETKMYEEREVFKMHKEIYGLVQASRYFYQNLSTFLMK